MPSAVVALIAVSRPFLETEVRAKPNLLFGYRDIERLLQKTMVLETTHKVSGFLNEIDCEVCELGALRSRTSWNS
jgi:hypothetical protein